MAKDRHRAVSETLPGGIRVRVPVRKNWPMLLFAPVWLVGWAFGEVTVIAALFGGAGLVEPANPSAPVFFLLLWLTLWTIGGGFMLVAFAWNAFGREVIEISGRVVRVRQEALGVGRTREYDAAHVAALRVSAAPFHPSSFRSSLRYWEFGNGIVAFDHDARTIRVFCGVDEPEAASIVAELKARLGVD